MTTPALVLLLLALAQSSAVIAKSNAMAPASPSAIVQRTREVSKKDLLIGDYTAGVYEESCMYTEKRESSDGPSTYGTFYAGGGHVPSGTSPTSILPYELLKREDESFCCALPLAVSAASIVTFGIKIILIAARRSKVRSLSD